MLYPRNLTFERWARLIPFTDFKMQTFSRPEKVGGIRTPENLNELTIGQLIEMSSCADGFGMFYNICRIVLGLTEKKTRMARALDVVRFVGWVTGEVEKINKLFESTSTQPTEVERRAGIERLRFGLFGMLDYYALRMGIKDHDEVLNVKWMRVYKCIDIDNQKNLYQRRLQEVITNEYRRKSH